MNKTKHISLLLFVSVAITLFFSCRKKPDMPPVTPYAIGNTMTIQQLRDFFISNGCVSYKFTKDVSLYATVTMSDNYKTLFLRDNTGAICLKQLTAHSIFQGDSLRINLHGSWLDLAGPICSIQIDSVDVSSSPTNKVVKLDVGKNPSPIIVTIAQLNSSATNVTYPGNIVVPHSVYDGQLVQLNDVQYKVVNDTGTLFIPLNPPSNVYYYNHTLVDCGALNSIVVSLYKQTSDFVYQKVPGKGGSIIAAVSFYNGAVQLTPRSFHEMNFTQPRCGVDTLTQSFSGWINGVTSANYQTVTPGWVDVPEVKYLYWLGPFNVASPPGFASASNYGAPANTRNVMWLISPPIQNSPTKNISFQTSFSSPTGTHPKQLSVFISTDFNGTNLGGTFPVVPAGQPKATWTDITSAFPLIQDGSSGVPNWPTNASALAVMFSQFPLLASYSGTFYIGFRYTAQMGTDSTQTINVQNVAIKN